MTKAQDNIAIEANKAAQLIKSTAETTATALNIQYIQKDILEIKDGVKSLTLTQDTKITELEQKVEALQKQQWMFSGAVAVLAVAIPIVLKYIIK